MTKGNGNSSNDSAERPSKAAEAAASSAGFPQEAIPDDPAPAYEEQEADTNSPQTHSILSSKAAIPTVNSPFNFPTIQNAPPVYSNAASSSRSNSQPIVIPQVRPEADSPFLFAYAPILLNYGVTSDTWRSFLDTMSAFLSAKVSDRAISHAADMGQQISEAPKRFSRSVVTRAKIVKNSVMNDANRGNVASAAITAVAEAVVFPITTAVEAVGAVLSLPGEVIGAVTKKPKTPLERATAYVAVANKQWLHARGLNARLVDSVLLAQLTGLSANRLLEIAGRAKERDAAGQMRALEGQFANVEVQEGSPLELKEQTLWLMLIPK